MSWDSGIKDGWVDDTKMDDYDNEWNMDDWMTKKWIIIVKQDGWLNDNKKGMIKMVEQKTDDSMIEKWMIKIVKQKTDYWMKKKQGWLGVEQQMNGWMTQKWMIQTAKQKMNDWMTERWMIKLVKQTMDDTKMAH